MDQDFACSIELINDLRAKEDGNAQKNTRKELVDAISFKSSTNLLRAQ